MTEAISQSRDERLKLAVRGAIQSLTSNFVPNKRVDILKEAIAEAVYELLGNVGEIVITPKPDPIGLSGLRRTEVIPLTAPSVRRWPNAEHKD